MVPAGDRPRDLGEAAVGLAVPGEAFLQRHDAVETAIPFANQDGAGFDPSQSRPWPALPARLSAAARPPSAEALERPTDGVGEIAESIRLQAIGENARQERLRQMDGSAPAKDVSPLQAKAGQIERPPL